MKTYEDLTKMTETEIGVEDIAQALYGSLNVCGAGIIEAIENAIFNLKACAENEHNKDEYRIFYNVLVAFTEEYYIPF